MEVHGSYPCSEVPGLDEVKPMTWQSRTIAVVQLIFALALIPTVLDSDAQVPRISSGITALGLWLIAFVYTRMPKMREATWMCTFCALCWTFVFIWRPVP